MNKRIGFLIIILAIIIFFIVAMFLYFNRVKVNKIDTAITKNDDGLDIQRNLEIVTVNSNQNVISPNDKVIDKEKEEYILRSIDGYIGIYKVNDEEKEELIKITNIVTNYLPILDKNELENGIKIYGKENLNLRLEDYE